jgi:hypothetical protein
MFRRTTTILQSAAALAAGLMSITIAAAQEDAAESRALTLTNCGPPISSQVRTQNAPSVTNSVAFVPLAGAATNFAVPAGASRCVKVLFTAKAACRGPAAVTDFCFVRALLNGVEMPPQGAGFQTFVSEDPTENAHAYMWAVRIGAGNHVIAIQRRVGNAATSFLLDDWTFDVSLYN